MEPHKERVITYNSRGANDNTQKYQIYIQSMGYDLPRSVWVMGYGGVMGYGSNFPANQVGHSKNVWVMGYGKYYGLWVKIPANEVGFAKNVWVITGYGV